MELNPRPCDTKPQTVPCDHHPWCWVSRIQVFLGRYPPDACCCCCCCFGLWTYNNLTQQDFDVGKITYSSIIPHVGLSLIHKPNQIWGLVKTKLWTITLEVKFSGYKIDEANSISFLNHTRIFGSQLLVQSFQFNGWVAYGDWATALLIFGLR